MQKSKQIIFGVHAVMEALDAGKEIEKVLVRKGSESVNFRMMMHKLREHGCGIQYVPMQKLNSITTKNHQGVIAWLSEISYSDIGMVIPAVYESGEVPLVLVLDRVSDVRNFGAIARTAECAGVHAIIIPVKGSAMINAEAIKTSSGALHKIAVCRSENLLNQVKFLKESGLQIFAASEKGTVPYYEARMTGPSVIIMGSEEQGISMELIKAADHLVAIPMKGSLSSLNVSVAAGILLFEVNRQRNLPTPKEAGG